MSNDICLIDKKALLEVFVTEEDRRGTDLLAMSDFFSLSVSKLDTDFNKSSGWEIVDGSNLIGEITTAIKIGYDIAGSSMLVADSSHFSKDIIDGIKSGKYRIGRSKEVAGNLRPVVVDKNTSIVKTYTLKKAINPTDMLKDIAIFSMQSSLKQISLQLEEIERDLQGLISFERRTVLNDPFINAREYLFKAMEIKDIHEQKDLISSADKILITGLTHLYSDLYSNIDELGKMTSPFRKLKTIDKLLSYINEDLQMIPKYIGMRILLNKITDNIAEINRTIGDYQYHIEKLFEKKYKRGKYSALETIHRYYLYDKDNLDFWLTQPTILLDGLNRYKRLTESKINEVYLIEEEA